MATQVEEQQAAEFLRRAEIRTMRKDLLALREADALGERNKIAKLKTLEEQLQEKKKALEAEALAKSEKAGLQEVLQKNENEEWEAEKDLKKYATEPERQQIFLLESERFAIEEKIKEIDSKKDPALKLQKNKLLMKKRDQQKKLDSILEQEKKLEEQQKLVIDKQQTTAVAEERKGLEQSRWDLDKKIQDVEKIRWSAEKEIEDTNSQINRTEISSEQLMAEKNDLRNKILGADKSLREIYSVVIAREEENRNQKAKEQLARQKTLAETHSREKDIVQRQQWSHSIDIPVPVKRTPAKSFEDEEEKRRQFIKDVEEGANK